MNAKHILIVDGKGPTVQATKKLLEANNYKVNVAHSGSDALKKVHQYPDLILVNRVLPDIEGLEICRQIQEDKRLRHISMIIFAAGDKSSERVEGLSAGADDYISDPIDGKELIARIEAVLRRNQVFRQAQKEEGSLVAELKKILKEKTIVPYFQPIYSAQTLKPIGLEALSRPPTGGLIDSAEFLFKTALILDMYSEVEMLCWETAVVQWKENINQGKLFLNCTPYFVESGWLNKRFFSQLGVNFEDLVLEITERTVIQRHDIFLKEIKSLRELGIKIAIDDVGSGFASLDAVVEVRPDIVKIDRELVRELHKDELKYNIMQAIVSFCKKSHVMTIAEGVQEEQELDAVNELGVDAIQGYLLSRPMIEIDPDIFFKKFDG